MSNKEQQDKYRQLREFYQQFPLGVTIEDYSGVKQGIDRLLKGGIDDLDSYLVENPDTLLNLVQSIQVIDVNDSMLEFFQASSLEQYISIESELLQDTGWVDFYVHEFVNLEQTGSHYGVYMDLMAENTPINFECNSWILTGHEHDWSVVITIHEDITENRQVELALNESKERYQQAAELAKVGHWRWDVVTDSWIHCSTEMARVYGLSAEEFISITPSVESIISWAHPEDQDVLALALDELQSRQMSYDIKYRVITQAGEIRYIRDIGEPVLDEDGIHIQSQGIVQDVTELMETQSAYEWAAEIAKLGHYIWDEISNKCVYCSPELARMYDLTPEQYIESSKNQNQNVELVHPDDRELFATITQDIEEDLEFVSRILKKNGEVLYYEEYGRRIRDSSGRVIRTNGIIRDITEEKKAADALQYAVAEAESANRAKSEFLATMSHELRTPLNAILGFSDILSEQYFGPPGAGKYREYAKDIHVSGRHLLELVNDLLDISSIEAGKTTLEIEELSVDEIIDDCARIVDETIQSKGIDFSYEVTDKTRLFHADKRAAQQVLLNLLWNAVKFTPDGGSISILVGSTDQNTRFEITDTGAGIPAHQLSTITNPFTRSDTNPQVSNPGWGLGLSITKSLVELHRGSMQIESQVGEGTTVAVEFPSQAM